MIEVLEHLESALAVIVKLISFLLEAISVFCVLLGLIKTAQHASNLAHLSTLVFVQIRLTFGSWLALALEFQLGADILGTTLSPSFEALGKLGIVAVIRILLNYFLAKEIESQMNLQEKIAPAANTSNNN